MQNGDSGEHSGAESLHVNGEAVSGSDTDISRPGSVDPSKQDIGHVRTSSMKKPAAFKSVSVTKSFLAKSAASTPAASPGLKAAPAVQPATSSLLTAKPRLVAKSGTTNAPRTLGKMNGAGAGPDASKVWNKNQPVPPPPPKQYTDEELKQQYGIHLATRLPMDEAGKEAKWADIDDDDADWAPDAVEWMDGTKSSVTAPEVPPPPPVEEAPRPVILAKPDTVSDGPKPAAPVPTSSPKTSVTGGPKTILKPGGHAQTGGATKSSLVLKGQPEKPTLVSKPSTGTPAKSPWATLPPVEKVSPIQINPPLQQQSSNNRFSTQDHRAYESMPPHHGREIAPDDFNRTWREERGGRELFNSQNGRYEPVNDARRGSFRDSGYRQQQQHPSLLQRPSHDGAAEPSSAFQTSRSSAEMPSWGRRRTSSNVSGGPGRRMSFNRGGPEFANAIVDEEHRAPHSVNGIEPAGHEVSRQSSVAQGVSPHVAQAYPAAPQASVAPPANEATPAANAAPTMEDQVEAQKRMMADKIERARLKKQQQLEAEKKEEEEKKARIAKRLAALGEAPKPKTSEKASSPAIGRSPQKTDAALAPVQSPPKPPVPSGDGEVAQYGMMKVHQSHPVKKHSPVPQAARPVESQLNAPGDSQVRLPLSLDQPPVLQFDSNRDHAKKAADHPRTLAEGTGPHSSKQTQPAWQGPGSQTRGGWTSQVWGSAQTRDRNLGNGTFDSGFNRGQPRPSSQQQLPTQASSVPIAPIGVDPVAATIPHTVKMPLSSQSIHQPSRQIQTVPGPIAPPTTTDNKWGNFAAHIARDDANMVVKVRQDRDRIGGETFRPELRETYKDQRGKAQTMVHSKVGSTALESGANVRVSPAASELKSRDEAMNSSHDGSSPQQLLVQGTPLQQTGGSRSSRFFPRPIETSFQTPMLTSSKADSPPPPPETESHPVFAGSGISHPLVRLPRPSPVVRLPKPAQEPADAPASVPSRGYHGPGARPLAMNPEWQARFNKLLDKPAVGDAAPTARSLAPIPVAVPSKPSALAIAASSKASLDVRGHAGSATVSLPNAAVRKTASTDRARGLGTRDGTAALFEDREFGSLPTVRLPKVSHATANEPPITLPKVDDLYIRLIKKENPFTTKRLDAFDFGTGTEIDVIVRLEHMRAPITKTMPKPRRGKGNGPYNKPKRNGTPTGPQTGGSKDRSRKPSQQGQGERTNSSPRVSLPPSAWPASSRPTATPKRESWAQRAAAAAAP